MQYHVNNIRELPNHKNTMIPASVASVAFVASNQILQSSRSIQKDRLHVKIRGNQLHDGFHASRLRRVMA